MPSNIKEVLFIELDNVPIKDPIFTKIYLRDYVARAYTGSCFEMNLSVLCAYVKEKGIDAVKKEMRSMIYRGDTLLDINELFDRITNEIYLAYIEKKKIDDNIEQKSSKDTILEKIDALNMNENAKKHFKDSFLAGNYDVLSGLIEPELLEQYISENNKKMNI